MQISKAELTPDGIRLTVSRDEARRFCYSFKPGEYDIKKTRKKRSMDANAYAWKLINDISLATRISPEEVYRNALLDIPTLYYIALIPDEYTDAAMTDWQKVTSGARRKKNRHTQVIQMCFPHGQLRLRHTADVNAYRQPDTGLPGTGH